MSNTDIQINDTVYLFNEDPKCDTIYIVTEIGKDGSATLYHPIKHQVEASIKELKHSVY